MARRLRLAWKSVSESLWVIPTAMTLVAVFLALGMVRIDRVLGLDEQNTFWWVLGGGSDGAFRVLTVIAGTMVSVIGVVFSVTVVSLTLASSQFSPLVLRTFTSDRANQLVFGIFFATFTYALLVTRAVRASTDRTDAFAAPVSTTFAIVLAFVSVISLIYFIDHIARSIQAPVIVARAAMRAHRVIDTLYPADIGEPASTSARQRAHSVSGTPGVVYGREGGYLQRIEERTIFALRDTDDLVIEVELYPGTFIIPGNPIANVWPAERLDDGVATTIRESFLLDLEPTTQSDIGFGVRQLADIATKALSPGINDIATAKICIDRVSELVVRLANHNEVEEVRVASREDESVVLLLRSPSFAELIDAGFSPIRTFGAGNPDIASYLLESLKQVVALTDDATHEALRTQGKLVLETAREQVAVSQELHRIEQAGTWLDE